MENLQCPAEDSARLLSIARDFCPFPDYNPNPHFFHMLSLNSSLHLKNHYTAVQSSLTPQQLDDFTKSLRTTFGREGKVTLGGVGVVALSLALLFDAIARQVKGERVSESELIPGLFLKDLRGYYPPLFYTISSYLRLVPHIANNPSRMTEETERCLKQILNEDQTLADEYNKLKKVQDTTVINLSQSLFFAVGLNVHLIRIKNGTEKVSFNQYNNRVDFVFNLNCDSGAASEKFVAEIPAFDNHTQECLKRCSSYNKCRTVLDSIAGMGWLDILFLPTFSTEDNFDKLVEQREDFDLKADALGEWK